MSNQTFLAFITAAGENADIGRGLADAVNGLDGAAAVRAVSGYATARGFPLSPAEIEAGRMEVIDALESQSELSDAELESVAGGAIDLHSVALAIHTVNMAMGIGTMLAAYNALAMGTSAVTLTTIGARKSLDAAKSFFKGW